MVGRTLINWQVVEDVPASETMAVGKSFVKTWGSGKWKWSKSPGDRVKTAVSLAMNTPTAPWRSRCSKLMASST